MSPRSLSSGNQNRECWGRNDVWKCSQGAWKFTLPAARLLSAQSWLFLLLLFQEWAERLVINASAISKCQGSGGFECIKPDLVGPRLQDFWVGPAWSYTLELPLALAVPGGPRPGLLMS